MTIRLLVYLNMSLCYMFTALVASQRIKENPEDNRQWLVGLPAVILTIGLLVVMAQDVLSNGLPS